VRKAQRRRQPEHDLLTAMSLLGGLVIYGYLGLYPTFLREGLGYSPQRAGR